MFGDIITKGDQGQWECTYASVKVARGDYRGRGTGNNHGLRMEEGEKNGIVSKNDIGKYMQVV